MGPVATGVRALLPFALRAGAFVDSENAGVLV